MNLHLWALWLQVSTLAAEIVTKVTERERLQLLLLKNYSRISVPVDPDVNHGVNITIYMWPYDILDVNEAKSSMKISGWIDMRWIDYRLRWNESQYKTDHVFIPEKLIWLPNVDLFYSKEDNARNQNCPECQIRVTSDGAILRGYYFSYAFPCSFSVKYFPFDMQSCALELANWHLDDTVMDLWPHQHDVDLSIFLSNEEWELLEMNVTRKRDYYNYGYFPILRYNLRLKRKSFYFVVNLVIPSQILTITAILGYHMPSTGTGVHQEKVKMGLTTILSIYILQLGVSDRLPRTSEAVPLIFIFYTCMVVLLALAIASTSLIILIEKQGIYGKPVPNFVRRFVPALHTGHTLPHKIPIYPKNCRMLDCGCRLRKRGRYQPLDCCRTPSPEMRRFGTKQRGLRRPEANSYAAAELMNAILLETVQEIRDSLGKLCEHMEDRRIKSLIRTEWNRLADFAERISLTIFIMGAVISSFMLLYGESWY